MDWNRSLCNTCRQNLSVVKARADPQTFYLHATIQKSSYSEDGKKEIKVLEEWAQHFPNVISTAGKLTINMELALMSNMDVMLVMDAANMHLASLVNIPVVSIWGATHPCAGFAGWNQSAANIIQIDLPCRPCSLSGRKHCYRKDYACLQGITPEMVIEHINKVIS